MKNLFKRYNDLKKLVVERKDEFDTLINFLENETAWLKAPASTKYHLCKEGGLLEHTCNVAETMLKMKAAVAPKISDESCAIVALLHDVGKIGMPDNPQYIEMSRRRSKSNTVTLQAYPTVLIPTLPI